MWTSPWEDNFSATASFYLKEESDVIKSELGCEPALSCPEREVFVKSVKELYPRSTAGFVVNMSSLNMCNVLSSLPSSIQMQGIKLEMWQSRPIISECDLEMLWEPNQEANPRDIDDNNHPYFFRESGYGKSINNLDSNKFNYAVCSKVNGKQDAHLGMRCQTKLIEIQPMNRIKVEPDLNASPIDDKHNVLNVQKSKKPKEGLDISLINCRQKSEQISSAWLFKSSSTSDAKKPSHKCKVCSRKFEKESMLKKHLKTHGNRQYICMLCSQTFTFNCNLVRHQKLHTGCTKLWNCSKCSRVFRRKYHLDRHLKTHKRKLKCRMCPRKFSCESERRSHLQTHARKYSKVLRTCSRFSTLAEISSKRYRAKTKKQKFNEI